MSTADTQTTAKQASPWKAPLRLGMEQLQQQLEQQHIQQRQNWQVFCTQWDLPGWLAQLQQQQAIQQDWHAGLQRSQQQATSLWQSQWLSLASDSLRIRNSAEAMLAMLAWHNTTSQQWQVLGNELMQLCNTTPQAHLACWQQYLAAEPN